MADAKLAGAALGGYLLGRTKKGKAAIRFAMWLSGKQTGPQVVGCIQQATSSPEAAKIIAQLRGPMLQSAQAAATATLMSRLSDLSETLADKTKALTEVGDQVDDLKDKVSDVNSTISDTVNSAEKTAESGLPGGDQDDDSVNADAADRDEEKEKPAEKAKKAPSKSKEKSDA